MSHGVTRRVLPTTTATMGMGAVIPWIMARPVVMSAGTPAAGAVGTRGVIRAAAMPGEGIAAADVMVEEGAMAEEGVAEIE